MDLCDRGALGVATWMAERAGGGNDLRNRPTGDQRFADTPFRTADPATNGRKAVLAVGPELTGLPARVEIPIDASAGALYLLHAASRIGPAGIACALTFIYADGSEHSVYLHTRTHISGWWFPGGLAHRDGGVAWRGANGACGDVGIHWVALANPQPGKAIARIAFAPSSDGAVYGLVGLTLADRMPYNESPPVSHGGPDNWAGGTCMLALIEGMAGVRDDASAYSAVTLSPRWTAAGVASAAVTARYGASRGYVAYRWSHDADRRRNLLSATGSAGRCRVRILLPTGARAGTAEIDGRTVAVASEQVGDSRYAVLDANLLVPTTIALRYDR